MLNAKVVKTSLLSTVQDQGRAQLEHLGVRTSGAMDSFASRIANRLLGNAPDCAVLESTFGGDKLVFDGSTQIAVTGAELELQVNGLRHPMWSQIHINAGDELALGFAREGVRAYISILGGWQTPRVLGSRASDLARALGDETLDALSIDQALPYLKSDSTTWRGFSYPSSRRMELYQSTNQIKRIRLIEGPEKPRLTKAFLKYCEQGVFTVGKESNRQALTLESESDSPAPLSEVGADIVSSYTTFGTIQVPAHGRLTVLMADRQSTGGFARIGQVAAADLPVLGQMRQGQRLCFSWISIEEARSLQSYFESTIDHALLSSPLN